MLRKWFYLASFLVGILLIPVGIIILVWNVRAAPNKYSYLNLSVRIETDAQYETAPPPLPLGVQIKAPRIIHLDESASVWVDASVPTRDLPRKPFSRLPFLVNLSAAGLNVEPKDWLSLHAANDPQHWTAVWSVRANSPGSYLLVFNPKLDLSSFADTPHEAEIEEFDKKLFVVFAPDAVVPIEVVPGWRDYMTTAWGPLVTFMGSLLILPGIISFLKDRKREREEKKEKPAIFE